MAGNSLSGARKHKGDWPSDDLDIMPKPSIIFVPERVHIMEWTPWNRKAFRQAQVALAELGLSLLEADPFSERVRHPARRITLPEALANLTKEGVLFEEWAKLYLDGASSTPEHVRAAHAKARVAMYRLVQKQWIKKVYRADGKLTLVLLKEVIQIEPRDAWRYPDLYAKDSSDE